MPIHNEIDDAILAHQRWIKKIKTVVAVSSRTLNTPTEQEKQLKMISNVQSDENCHFGQWLYAISNPEFKCATYYEQIKKLHFQFHQEAAEILTLSLNGSAKKANLRLAEESSFMVCSSNLITKLEEWKGCLNEKEGAELIFLDFD